MDSQLSKAHIKRHVRSTILVKDGLVVYGIKNSKEGKVRTSFNRAVRGLQLKARRIYKAKKKELLSD